MFKSISCFIAIALVFALQISRSVAGDTDWDRTVLPRPPQPFQGVTKRTLEGSVAAFTQPVKAPPNPPNILLAENNSIIGVPKDKDFYLNDAMVEFG